jgi:hypothetical protein
MDFTQMAGPLTQVMVGTALLLVAIAWSINKLFRTTTDTYGVIIQGLHTELNALRADNVAIRTEAANDRVKCAADNAGSQGGVAMIDRWGPVVDTVLDFLDKHPDFKRVERELWHRVCSELSPWSENALPTLEDSIKECAEMGLDRRDAIIRHLNINSPQSEAHYQTMAHGAGQCVARFSGDYGGTVALMMEDEEAQKAKQLPCGLKEEAPRSDPESPMTAPCTGKRGKR